MLPRLHCETVYLSLGSNLGDRASHLQAALESLSQHLEIAVLSVSSLYETEPQDVPDQPWFLNRAAAITTDLTPHELLQVLQTIEREAGRARTTEVRRGPRPLDLDILLFGTQSINTPDLTIPHPRITGRRFVLEPLLELNPELRHPVTNELLSTSLTGITNQAVKRIG